MSGVANKPAIEAYIGASGSGKGVSIDRRLKVLKPRRLLIWDPRDEYARWGRRVTDLRELVREAAQAGDAGAMKLRYVPGHRVALAKAFEVVCGVAFEAGDLVFLAEELSDTTSGGYAPPAWRRITTQGRHRRLHVMGAAQRPALIDKTFLGNATYIRCFTLRYAADRRAMAQALDCPESRVTELQTVEGQRGVEINYLERDFRGGSLQAGRILLGKRA